MNITNGSIVERLVEIERKIKILVEQGLTDTTTYLMLRNAKMNLRDQLAKQLTESKEAKS